MGQCVDGGSSCVGVQVYFWTPADGFYSGFAHDVMLSRK